MKRSPLARGTSNLSRSPLARGKRVKARRETPRTRTAPRGDAAWWETATMTLLGRCGSRCEVCGWALGDDLARHHRQKRAIGGERLSQILMLHTTCHQRVHANPQEARDNGWIVSMHAPDPAAVPVLIDGTWWLLDDDGTRTPSLPA